MPRPLSSCSSHEPVTAVEMRQWNVVNLVVDDDDLETEAMALGQPPGGGTDKGVRRHQSALAAGIRRGCQGRQGEALRRVDADF